MELIQQYKDDNFVAKRKRVHKIQTDVQEHNQHIHFMGHKQKVLDKSTHENTAFVKQVTLSYLKSILDSNPKMSVCVGDGLLYGNNAGALFRSLKAFGCDCFILCPPTKELYEKLKKSSTEDNSEYRGLANVILENGVVRYVNGFKKDILYFSRNANSCDIHIVYNFSIKEVTKLLFELGYQINAIELHTDSKYTDEVKFQADRFAFVLGNERHGVSKFILDEIEKKTIRPIQIRTTFVQECINVCCAGLITINKRFADTNFYNNIIDNPQVMRAE